jgi:hypothetical protein
LIFSVLVVIAFLLKGSPGPVTDLKGMALTAAASVFAIRFVWFRHHPAGVELSAKAVGIIRPRCDLIRDWRRNIVNIGMHG